MTPGANIETVILNPGIAPTAPPVGTVPDDVATFAAEAIERTPDVGGRRRPADIGGIGRSDGSVVVLPDPHTLFHTLAARASVSTLH